MKKYFYLLLLSFSILSSCKDKNEPEPSNNNGTTSSVLVIENGSAVTSPGNTITYSARIVDAQGNTSTATGVTWSSSNSDVITFSGSSVSTVGAGNAVITATVTVSGQQISASVPIAVNLPSAFAVAPGAIAIVANEESIQLEPVYLGTGNPGTYTYSSSNSSVASVSSSGLVTFPGAGQCVISVTAPGLDGQPTVQVPVYVTTIPSVTLPVSRVVVTPKVGEIFKNEELQYTAKAYNSSGTEVASTFVWKVSDVNVASIDQTGKVTGLKPGSVMVQATTSGIIGEAALEVVPNTIIELTPIIANIAPSASRQFTAMTYSVSKAGGTYALTQVSNPSDLTWEIPTYGLSIFDIASVNSSGLVTMKSNATVGFISAVIAYSPSNADIVEGSSAIMVSDCDCGAGTGVTSISTDMNTYNLDIFNPNAQITATTLPGGQPVSYCSDTPSIVTVSSSGLLTGVDTGTAKVKICNGSTEKEVTVIVNFD